MTDLRRWLGVVVAAVGFLIVGAVAAQADVYWVNAGDGTIGRSARNGTGVSQNFITGAGGENQMAVDDTYIYWTRRSANAIGRATLEGQQVDTSFISGIPSPNSVAVDSGHIYWTNASGNIGRANLDGSGVDVNFIGGGNGPVGIAVDDSYIYWGLYGADAIARASIDGSSPDYSFITGVPSPKSVAVTDTHIYWDGLTTSMGRANLDGSAVDTNFLPIVTLGQIPDQIAVDDQFVYWVSRSTGAVGRAKLDGTNSNASFITGGNTSVGLAVDVSARFSAAPSGKDFGETRVDAASGWQTFTITNTGKLSLDINSGGVTLDGSDTTQFAIGTDLCSSASLPPGQSCTVDVRFTPTSSGAKTADLAFETNLPSTPHLVPLSGTGIEPVAGIEPSAVAFGNQNISTSSAARTVTVANEGSAPLAFGASAVTLTGVGVAEFVITQDGCSSMIVAVGATCTVKVRFSPTSTGAKAASLRIVSDAPSSPDLVALTGTGVEPLTSVNPVTVTFGDQNTSTTSPKQSVTVTNTGTGTLTIGSPGISVSGPDADQFTISDNTCAGSNTPPAGSCTVNVSFTPTSTGPKTATLSIASNTTSSPDTVPLTGVGVQPGFQAAAVDFGDQRVGVSSPERPVTVTNIGTGPLTFGAASVTLSGPDAAQFRITSDTCTGGTVAPGATCAVAVVFTPTSTAAKSGQLRFVDNAAGSPHSVPISGTGVQPGMTLTPGTIAFPEQTVGTRSAAQSITVSNPGQAPLLLGSGAVTLTDGAVVQYEITSDGCSATTVAPGSTCSVGVIFKPSTAGSSAAILRVSGDAPGGAGDVLLTGTGVSAPVPPDPLAAPTAVKVTARKATVRARWQAAAGASTYRAVLKGKSKKGKRVTKTATTAGTSVSLKAPLKPGSAFTVCVTASNGADASPSACAKGKAPRK